MPAKQKVTLYISDDLHRQFKIRSAVDGETMSSMAQRAMEFYLGHAELIENSDKAHGQTHRIHTCPECSAAVTVREDGLALIGNHAERQVENLLGLERMAELNPDSRNADEGERSLDEGELITC
ncbi:hypothetical protein BH23CYA1_BH23CYA1_04240 [soil metagenome]|uniref:hypothetical protein n=1 Tax=Leptolyngbya sp. BC1307 TaxID=2029589 RepID=UPI000EFC8768|nr:hypothetical protein [Leptolyngbya sp. BC1307]